MEKNNKNLNQFAQIKDVIEDIRLGKMVIIVDDEDRENEGDLMMAADKIEPEDINFMLQYARGLVCLTLTQSRCKLLDIPLMVNQTDSDHQTYFTVSIEAVQGVSTGSSVNDRTRTIRAAVAVDARTKDLKQPGHVFPLMARKGGVLERPGHTEAGCDLTRLAGLRSAAVIVEILNKNGAMASRNELFKFASEHRLKIASIADLISYRLENEDTHV
jgi:3,4-dihydroxy 2-butanone 4-phosphate synthase/GTP cyclohydrolase II